MAVDPLRPSEFCSLERQLVERMAMRKKRNVEMEPMQALKLALLAYVEQADPVPELFSARLAEAVVEVSQGLGTGPAQAVASDLQLDWDLACAHPGFVTWLRNAATTRNDGRPTGRRGDVGNPG
jgi:hypothetical protein